MSGWGLGDTGLASHRALMVVGAVLGVASLLVTAVANIPRNNALAALDPDAPAAAGEWAAYQRSWTAWNHVRVVAALAAAVLLAVALHR